jgi:CubicO group peptidase (beta-lactamase class C family)
MAPRRQLELDPARLDRAFDVVARHVSDGRATYAALGVAGTDGPPRIASYHRDRTFESAPRTAIASITKPITATAILQLVEAGKLVLTEPLTTYLPEFRPAPPPDVTDRLEPITTWHVLTHTAGLTDASDSFLGSGIPTPARMLERVCRDPLRFAPGSAYAYCSDSFYLLAELVERLSGIAFRDYLTRRIFEPLGMPATSFDPRDDGPPSLPLEGTIGPPGLPNELVAPIFIALAMPGGGLWSTPADVIRFGLAMLGGGTLDGARILGRPFVDLMTRDHTPFVDELDTGRSPHYGLGWGRPGLQRGSPASPSAFGHGGASGSCLLVDPGHDLVVVYLRNDWGAPVTATDEAVQAVYGALG